MTNNRLLFFNENGYPYNFEVDPRGYYSGVLNFDENSSDTFKTIGIYIFEEVAPFILNDLFTLNKMEIYNDNGVTFQPFTNSGVTITNITKVNSSDTFFSKWVFGEEIDKKFPKGTLVSFSGVSFNATTTDFDLKYYTVLDNKPGAILVNTETLNSDWNLTFNTGNTTINSHNIISYNDYDNSLNTDIGLWTLHDTKKFSIVGSELNDGVKTFKDKVLTKTIYQTYDVEQFSGNTSDILKFDFELKTERPKLYQGPATFDITGSVAYITFDRKINSLINLEEGEQIIFEDYDDEPILPSNPIFTIIDGTTDVELFNGDVEFVEELNINKTFLRHFDDKSLSSQEFINNVSKSQLINNTNYYTTTYPKHFFEYDYFIQLTGTTENFNFGLVVGDTIELSSTTLTSGVKNNSRKFTITDIRKFRDIRISFWKKQILSLPPWYESVKQKSIENGRSLEIQLELDAIYKYNSIDNKLSHSDYIPLNERYEKLKVKEYVLKEDMINSYKIQKLLNSSQVRTVHCNISSPVSNPTIFTQNVVAYDTSNILSFSQTILKVDDETAFRNERISYWENKIRSESYSESVARSSGTTIDENIDYYNDVDGTISQQIYDEAVWSYENVDLEGTNTPISYYNTISSFNKKYGDYLYKNYGILVYYNSITSDITIHSIYSLNVDSTSNLTFDNYFIPTLYLNDLSMSGYTGIVSGVTNKLLLEFDEQLLLERINPNETEKFDKNFSTEIYFNLNNNEMNYGFNLELNDYDYYISFVDDTQTTLNSFIEKYDKQFENMGLNLNTGTTIISSSSATTFFYYDSGFTSTIIGDDVSGYTLIISADYPNVDVLTVKPKVNIYSEFEILSEIENKVLLLSGNELELTTNSNTSSLYDYGFSTGMIISVSGSQYKENNINYNIIGLTDSIIELSYQGLFFADSGKTVNELQNLDALIEADLNSTSPPSKIYEYVDHFPLLTIDVERFLRKPRESVNKNVYYKFRFVEPYSPDIFFYDVSGEHLKPYLGDEKLLYNGVMPLWNTDVCSVDNGKISLIDIPNKNVNDVNDPTKQQTVFRGKDGSYCLDFLLDEFDSETEFGYTPEPLQVFLGFNSEFEGVSRTTVLMDKVEDVVFSGYTNNVDFNFNDNGLLEMITTENNFNFKNNGFDIGQKITIDFIDKSNTGTTIFENYGEFEIESVFGRKIKLKEKVRDTQYMGDVYKDVIFIPFSSTGTSVFYYEIKVQPTTILKLSIYGETEIEDERFRIGLNNLGIQLNEDIEHIFKESDIDEDGIDYIRLNQKRKEMLLNYTEIYNYIGSYKSLINAINYFGWNDLELFEYYKNIDINSPLYQKLQKVLIPDMFDNTIDGWTKTDYVYGKFKDGKFKKTNLFNLTYKITDEDGNNILLYSLDDVQIKLNKLKRWLKRNILPLSTNIIDITGVAEVVSQNYQNYDVSNRIITTECKTETTVVNFVYTSTRNFDTDFLFEIDFYTGEGNSLGGPSPSGWTCKIQTFSKNDDGKLIPQKYFKLMKNDLSNFSFNIDSNIDEYVYVETLSYNDCGVAQKYNKMTNSSITKNYILINNQFHITDYDYLNTGDSYYFFDENGYIFLVD